MEPLEFLRQYKYDSRLVTGDFFADKSLKIDRGDTVGVVLLNLGGPNSIDEIGPFLYNLFMDPAIIDIPIGGIFRHWLCRYIARSRSKRVAKDYQLIGGGSPINRLTSEQSKALQEVLNQSFGKEAGVSFKVYIAMRYWHPTSEEAASQMSEEGVNKVVLLPLYPHYSKTTTGASLVFWWMLQQQSEIETCPTVAVTEYATHPKYVQAISERIDEKLKEFPEQVRDDIVLLFSAHGTPVNEMKRRRDPYCCLIHSTVQAVMAHRKGDLPFHVAFQSKVGPAEWLTPSTPDKLQQLAEEGHTAVLVVPVAFVTDHIETAFELNIQFREKALAFGIEHYEVTGGLNSHPLFIEALAEAVAAQIEFPGLLADSVSQVYRYREMQQLPSSQRECRCHQCEYITEAVQWEYGSKGQKIGGAAP